MISNSSRSSVDNAAHGNHISKRAELQDQNKSPPATIELSPPSPTLDKLGLNACDSASGLPLLPTGRRG